MTETLVQLLQADSGNLNFQQALLALGAAYLGGILASLTPCVYPMIPITMSVVGGLGKNQKQSWHQILSRGLAYVLGMTIVYSTLGVVAGLTGKVFGSLTQTTGWYLGLGLIMNAAALIMLEVIPFDPQVWFEQLKRRLGFQTFRHLQPHSEEAPLFAAFTLGASSGFIAAPCTTPVLTGVLAYITKTQSVGMGFGLMVSFSLGLGTLLLLIATFAGSMRVLPKSGNWMKLIKITSGILLLGFAEFLIYTAGQRGGL